MMTEQIPDRRRSPRLEADFEAEMVVVTGDKAGMEVPGRVSNITKQGAMIQLHSEIPVGSQVSLIIYSEEYDSVCLGTVVWQKNTPAGMHHGIQISSWSYLDPILEHQLHFAK
jgi:hypothetical protein